jgi:hypothetical protein
VAAVKALAGGASGFADSRPCPAPAETGPAWPRQHRPGCYHGASGPSTVTCTTPVTFSTALAGCQVACYLVHSLSDADFSATIPAPPKRSARP